MSNHTYSQLAIPKTNIDDIDKQYQKIESILNDLIRNEKLDCSKTNLPPVFYSLMHLHSHYFTQEQITLAKYKFDGLCALKTYHKAFLDDVLLFQDKISENPRAFCTEMIEFLGDWSKEYFTINKTAVDFLRSKGVK